MYDERIPEYSDYAMVPEANIKVSGAQINFKEQLTVPEQPADSFTDLAREFFRDERLGVEIAFKVRMACQMQRGTAAHLRPFVRRDKFQAAANTIRRLIGHVEDLDVMTIADAMGRAAPVAYPDIPQHAPSRPISGVSDGPIVPSQTPELLAEYSACVATLNRLASGFDAMATRTRPERRGPDETPDSLMFSLEGLAALWIQHKGSSPVILGFKRGGFGDLAIRALKAGGSPFTVAAVRTGLRRLWERRVSQG